MAKKVLVISMIIFLVVILSVGGYFLYGAMNSGQTLSVVGYYNADKQEVTGGSQSVVNGVEGVKYIKLQVQVENKDTVPLNFKIIDASPLAFKTALSSATRIANKSEKAIWVSDFVDITPFENTTQDFSVTIEASSTLRTTETKNSKVSIKIDKDPSSSFDIVVTSEVNNNPAINPSCTESWTCGVWSICSNSLQTRICTDSNSCGTTTSRPALTQSCTAPIVNFETSAGTTYDTFVSGTWVKVDTNADAVLEQYSYMSTLTAGSCGGSLVVTTSGGLEVHKYSGSSGLSVYVCNPSGSGYKRYA